MLRRLILIFPVIAGTLMIMLAVLINGQPSVFSDTDDYFEHGKNFAYAVAYATHLKEVPAPPTDPGEIADAKQAAEDNHMSHPELAARSPYYGLLLYGAQRVGTIWLLAAIQAAIGAWLIWLLWRTTLPCAPLWTVYAIEGAAAFLTTLPFFAGFAMPDVFGAYMAIAVVVLIASWDRLGASERTALGVLIAGACTFHGSHPLLAVALGALGGALAWWLKTPRRALALSLATILGAVVAAFVANAIYMQAVKVSTGDTPGRPPFLAVRLLADGPGRDYLRYACAHGESYALCKYKGLPLDDTDEMLWSDLPTLGVFNMSDYATRVRMEHEEMRFVLSVVKYDPLGVAGAMVKNWGLQLTGVYADDPLRDPHYYLTNSYWGTTNLPWLIRHAGDCGHDNHGCASRIDKDGSKWLDGFPFVLALGFVAWRLSRRDVIAALKVRDGDAPGVRLILVMVLVAASLLINAGICGPLSGPFPRYQARIVWLMVLAASLGLAARLPQRAEVPEDQALRNALAHFAARPQVAAAMRQPMVAWALRTFDGAFIRFGLVGATGFIVDRLVLGVMVGLGLTPYSGRFVSFSVAVVATWLLNRSFTFRHAAAHPPLKQAVIYVAVQVAGGALNIGAYELTLWLMPALQDHLLVPLAIGSAAGLCLTFIGAKKFAFPTAAA